MSRKTLILFYLFLLTVLAFSYVYITSHSNSIFSSLPQAIPSPTVKQQSIIAFSPNIIRATYARPTAATIKIDTRGTPPTLVQLEIAYDPLVLTNIVIQPGDFFLNPNVLLNTVNPRNGRISYAVESASGNIPEKESGTIATIFFTPIIQTWQKETKFSFLPKTMLQTNAQMTPLEAAYGATVMIQPFASSSAILQPTIQQ